MSEFPFGFFYGCKKMNIMLCHGFPTDARRCDFILDDTEDLLGYCLANDIRAVILDVRYPDLNDIDEAQLTDRLRHYYKKRVNELLEYAKWTPNITEEYYLPAWEFVLAQMIEELHQLQEPEHSADSGSDKAACDEDWQDEECDEMYQDESDEDDDILADCEEYLDAERITAWVIHGNTRIKTLLYQAEEDANRITGTSMVQKYAGILYQELQKRKARATEEHYKIEQEKQKAVLLRIEQLLLTDPQIETLKTQKARNEYADRLLVKWQMEHGDDWLSKKAVRSLVEREYVKRTS